MAVSTRQLFILHGVPHPIWTYLVVTENSEEHSAHAKCHLSVHHLSCPEWSQQHPLNLSLYSSLFHSPGHVHSLGKASQTFLLSSRWCLSTPGILEDASFSTPTLVLSTVQLMFEVSVRELLRCCPWGDEGTLRDGLSAVTVLRICAWFFSSYLITLKKIHIQSISNFTCLR